MSGIQQSRDDSTSIRVACDQCWEDNELQPSYTKGDPRNIVAITSFFLRQH